MTLVRQVAEAVSWSVQLVLAVADGFGAAAGMLGAGSLWWELVSGC